MDRGGGGLRSIALQMLHDWANEYTQHKTCPKDGPWDEQRWCLRHPQASRQAPIFFHLPPKSYLTHSYTFFLQVLSIHLPIPLCRWSSQNRYYYGKLQLISLAGAGTNEWVHCRVYQSGSKACRGHISGVNSTHPSRWQTTFQDAYPFFRVLIFDSAHWREGTLLSGSISWPGTAGQTAHTCLITGISSNSLP